jgi:prolyl-tRNA synthetase
VSNSVLTSQAEDFPGWYQDLVAKAELADNGPVRGTMVIRPWAYAIWELIQRELDDRIKAMGVENAYFPLLIPESFIQREAEHVEGFSPELAVVTHAGGKQLEEPVVIRPTSETIINSFFAKWINSYRDLPMSVNNWSNVVRWELRPRLFLRTTEFLWQEGHTAHATAEEAQKFALLILQEVYREVMVDILAVPVLTGLKSDRERFAGAVRSWTCEGIMRDGKALQMGTSHELGQGFSKAFGTVFTDRENVQQHPWQTSWGVSTRLLGALIMAHGDDRGLRLPPRVAPVQVIVVVVKDGSGVAEAAQALKSELESPGVRVRVDDRVDVSFGRRVVGWELKGVPLRIEIGPRDVAEGNATLVSRARGEKRSVALSEVAAIAAESLDGEQAQLLADAEQLRDSRTRAVENVEDAIEATRDGAAVLPWAKVGEAGEQQLAEAGASVRCLRGRDGAAVQNVDGEGVDALVARAY